MSPPDDLPIFVGGYGLLGPCPVEPASRPDATMRAIPGLAPTLRPSMLILTPCSASHAMYHALDTRLLVLACAHQLQSEMYHIDNPAAYSRLCRDRLKNSRKKLYDNRITNTWPTALGRQLLPNPILILPPPFVVR